jgi:DNA repair protein RecN (Recombination protein N)
MLQHLSIKNYALIEALQLNLKPGFSCITGETGAGKSILLGALALVLGKRADTKVLRDVDQKCVVEATFSMAKGLKPFFEQHDLDYDAQSILRREILPSGKSRAFINDSPVKLALVQELAIHLIDVHSQHETILLSDVHFQMSLLDAFAKNAKELKNYEEAYKTYRKTKKELEGLQLFAAAEAGDADYLQFLYDELEEADVKEHELNALEDELQSLSRVDEIEQSLASLIQLVFGEDSGALDQVAQATSSLQSIADVNTGLKDIYDRLNSVRIELDDIRLEAEQEAENLNADPERATFVSSRIGKIMTLYKKHQVSNEEALLERKNELEDKVLKLSSLETKMQTLEQLLDAQKATLKAAGESLSITRKKAAKSLSVSVLNLLSKLNMPSATVELRLFQLDDYTSLGNDGLAFYFSANAGQAMQPLSKVASGGELSRVMLAIKAIMAQSQDLPSIIFDEIDSGVSGETALKIGEILKDMGRTMQVISITHLPQIAAKASYHLKVEKTESDGVTRTQLYALEKNEREQELARLLSGARISEAALSNARELLG